MDIFTYALFLFLHLFCYCYDNSETAERTKREKWDATCTDTLCPSNIHSTMRAAASAAEKAVQRKRFLYRDIISNYHFVVFATETMGPWCKEGKEFIEELGSMLNQKTADPKSKKYLKERISIAIQRGNATSILNTLPEAKGLDEVFLL